MTLKISVVVGNPKAQSRTLKVAETLVEKLFGDSSYQLKIIDLADHVQEIFTWPSDKLNQLNEQVALSNVAVFASPTYKATYTGLLKAFLDRYPANGLAGVTTIPILTGGSPEHFMGPTVNLAPLLVELGATVPGRGFYFAVSQMDRLDEVVQEAADEYALNLRRLHSVAEGLPNPPASLT